MCSHGLIDSWTSCYSAHVQSQVWQIWLAENTKRLLCMCQENGTFPGVAILGAYQQRQNECVLWNENETSQSSRVSRMELSFVITQGIFSYGVRPYITPLQAAAQPIRGNVKATCDVRRTNFVPRFSLLCRVGNNCVFPQRIYVLHWIITCFGFVITEIIWYTWSLVF